MSQGGSPGVPNGHTNVPPRDVPEEAVRLELQRILQSHEFRSSRRSQEFLRYVVENTVAGRAETLKERTIGVDVFSRPVSYDPSEDATVRVKAGEVRKRLGLYYAGEGKADQVRIDLPAGTYVPEFHFVDVAAAPAAVPAVEVRTPDAQVPVAQPSKVPRTWLWVAAPLLAIVVLTSAYFRFRTSDTVLDQFWAPLLKGSGPVLVCNAYVPDVYGLAPNASSPPKADDFVPLNDRFVDGRDLLAELRVTGMLNAMRRGYRVKIGSDVTFQDLRGAPTILIGYSYTRWRDISKEMRYFIDADRRPLMVTDNGAPTKWALPELPRDRGTNEDYAIISRVFHPDTQNMLVEIAGITQYGTLAAAEFVTSADLLSEAFKTAPDGWQKKNLQLVIHSKIISGTPASPRVVATYFW